MWRKVGRADISGAWRDGEGVVIRVLEDESGGLTVSFSNGRGPFRGSIQGDRVDVQFQPGCCVGTYNQSNETVSWDNDTTWSKIK